MSELEGWTPAFPGQRPPLTADQWAQPGNERSLRHGAYSPRKVDPLATEVVENLLLDEDVSFLRAASYRPAVWAWGRAEAQVQLLVEHIADIGGLGEALAETGTDESDETHNGGHSRRVSKTRRVSSALASLDRAERHAAACRARLGLDPLSRARLGKDVAAAKVDAALFLTQLREASERGANDHE